jgi:polysaccharide deacetylase 2 family uncharacterized protein YibQ
LDEDEEEERRAGWWGRFFRGMIFSVLVCGVAVWALSVYVLPPPPEPAPEPAATGQAETDQAPKVIAGIEVSTAPAYTAPTTPGAGSADEEKLGQIELAGPALTVNATAFTADPAAPLVAVVLDDAAANPLMHQAMFSVDLPVTIGVIAGKDGDRVTAKAAWEAGYEVLAELPIVEQGQGAGVMLEYGLPQEEAANRAAGLMQRLPMAVAASRPLASPAAPNAEVLSGIDSVLAPHGFGYVDVAVGPESESTAKAAGLISPVAVSRFTIPAGASAADAYAILVQAGADATKRGAAVVFATPGEQLFLALQLFGGEGTEGVARLAPLSAAISRQQSGN